LDDKLKEKIEHELSLINRLFSTGKPLLDLCKYKEPDFIEASAAGSFLHSFYNGIENTVLLIFKGICESIPNDFRWHKKLLDKMFESTEKRPALFKNDYKKQLERYMSFRHFFRHSYDYEIDIKQLKPLINGVEELWKVLEKDICNFIGF
jgi:hypothetical protein